MSLRYFLSSLSLPLGVKQPVFLLPPWSPTFRAGLERKSVSIFRLSSWAFCCGKADSFGALDEREWERERRRGREYFLQHFSLCLLCIYLVEPHSSSAANCPIGSSRTPWAASHSVLIWNSHRDLRMEISKVPIPVRPMYCTSATCWALSIYISKWQ